METTLYVPPPPGLGANPTNWRRAGGGITRLPAPATLRDRGLDDLADCLTKLKELVDKRGRIHGELPALRAGLEQAQEEDRRLLSDAIRKGVKHPGPIPAIAKAEKAIKEAERMMKAVDVAIDDQMKDLVALANRRRDAWVEIMAEARAAAAEHFAGLVEQVATAREELALEASIEEFVNDLPQSMRFKVATGHAPIPGLMGGSVSWSTVVDALRAVAAEAGRPLAAPAEPEPSEIDERVTNWLKAPNAAAAARPGLVSEFVDEERPHGA